MPANVPSLSSETADYLEGLMEGFVAYDAQWRMTYINAAGERLLGRERADVLGKTWHGAFPHAVGNPVDLMYQRVMKERRPERTELFYEHYGRWFEISAAPVRSGGVCVYFRDVSDRHRAEEALRKSEREMTDFFENAAVGLHWVGPDGTIVRANRAELELLGYAPEEYIGRHIAEFHADADNIQDILQCLGKGETLHNRQARLRCKDGTVIDVLISSNVLWEGERFVHTRCFTRDITGLKRAERALHASEASLREADRRKDEFLATLAHELRNPLAPIRNGLHLLRLSERDSETAEQARAMMERQMDHLVRLVDDLMEISRVNRGSIELQKEPIELAEVIGSAIDASRPAMEAARHKLSIDLPDESITLHADFVRLAQVLSNLLNNAAKYTPEGGRISLTVARQGDEAVIAVRDNGLGIPRDMLAKVFDMFAQVKDRGAHTQGGLGIGLALARKLVELHGGAIEARSDGPGQGSEFLVRLPIAEARRRVDLTKTMPPWTTLGPRGARRILVVDDNVDAAQSLGMLLTRAGHRVRIVHDGAAGLEAAHGEVPDVILLDLSMPGLDGLDLAQRLRVDPRFKPVRIVAITGLGQEEDRRKSRDAGFDEHLVKPVAPERLREVIERL